MARKPFEYILGLAEECQRNMSWNKIQFILVELRIYRQSIKILRDFTLWTTIFQFEINPEFIMFLIPDYNIF